MQYCHGKQMIRDVCVLIGMLQEEGLSDATGLVWTRPVRPEPLSFKAWIFHFMEGADEVLSVKCSTYGRYGQRFMWAEAYTCGRCKRSLDSGVLRRRKARTETPRGRNLISIEGTGGVMGPATTAEFLGKRIRLIEVALLAPSN